MVWSKRQKGCLFNRKRVLLSGFVNERAHFSTFTTTFRKLIQEECFYEDLWQCDQGKFCIISSCFFSCLINGHLSPRSALSLSHLHLYKTGQNSSPHRTSRSLQVFQQELCHIRPCSAASHKNRNLLVDIQNATISVITSNFSQLTTCPQNIPTSPRNMTSEP